MKIGILTQPLKTNYGGILQNYALQTVLKRMGHEVWTIDLNKKASIFRVLGSITVRYFERMKGRDVKIRIRPTKDEQKIISYHTSKFIEQNISKTKPLYSTLQLKRLQKINKFDAFIVGSDQVWRPFYSPNIGNYFLDFIQYDSTVKKIAYAVSFGVDNWEFTEKQTKYVKPLVKEFDWIYVREESGIKLCKKHLDVECNQALDPTLLLNKNDYLKLINKTDTPKNKGNLFYYLLDKDAQKLKIVNELAQKKGLIPFEVMPELLFKDVRKNQIEKCKFPPVEQWIKAFYDAEFIITDSFHGTVFSIIFEKQFLSLANMERGNSRFTSLLKQFGLLDRLIDSSDSDNLNEKKQLENIDYTEVNHKLSELRDKSLSIFNNLQFPKQ